MISSQKETEFSGEDFDGIKKVYTIWLVMDAPKGGANSIRRYEIKEKILHGHGREAVKNYDLMVAVMVYLGKKTTRHRLLRLLHLIFLDRLKTAEKSVILKRDYDMVLTPTMEEELSKMGSLALGIAERAAAEGERRGERRGRQEGIQEGRQEGRREGRWEGLLQSVRNLIKNTDMTVEAAMDALGISTDERQKVIAAL